MPIPITEFILLFSESEYDPNMSRLDILALNDPVICPMGCGKKFEGPTRNHGIKQHIYSECGLEVIHRCKECSLDFCSTAMYHLHKIRKHGML